MNSLIHIYRDNIFGRETLLQSALFCKTIPDTQLHIYIPQQKQFLLYYEFNVITVDLDSSYLVEQPNLIARRLSNILDEFKINYTIYKPSEFTASTLPNIPTNFDYMTCPRSIVEPIAKIHIGYLGARVRQIIMNANSPILITTPVFKEWKRFVCFFGGSDLSIKALELAHKLSQKSGLPLSIFTQVESAYKDSYQTKLKNSSLNDKIQSGEIKWDIFDKGTLQDNLFNIPYDSLAVIGAVGHKNLKEKIFGSKLEVVQENLPNPLLIIGPNYKS